MPIGLGTIYGAVRLRTDTLANDANAAKQIFDDLRNMVASLFTEESPAQPFVDAIAGLPATAEAAMTGVADAVKTGTEEASAAAEEGMTNVADAVKTSGDEASTSAQESTSRIADVFTALRDRLGSIGSGIGESVSGAFASIGESGATLAESMGGLHEGLGRLGEGFSETLGRATEFATSMLEFQALAGATQAVSEFAGSLIGMNSTFESLHQQLASITGSNGQADKILAWVKDFGQQIPDTTEHLAEATVAVQAIGVNATQVMPSLASVAAAMGKDLPTAARAFVDATEGRWLMMQNDLHVTKQQLEQFGLQLDHHGKVVNGTLIPAFEKLAKVKFGDALHNQMGTLQGQLSNLTDRVQFFAMSMGKPIFDLAKQGLGALFGFLDAHKKDIDAFADVVGKGLAGAFRFLGTAVSSVVNFFASHQAAVDALKAAFIGLGAALATFFATVIIPLIPGAIAALVGLAAVIGSVVVAAAPFIAVGLAVAGLALAVKHAYETSVPFRQAVQDIGAKVREFGQHVLAAGQALMTKLGPVVQQVMKHVQEFANELGTRVGPALTNVLHFFQMLGGWLQKVFTAIWPTLLNVLKGFWTEVQGIIQIAWSIISSVFKIALDILGGKWGKAWTDLKSMLSGVLQGIWTLIRGWWQAVTSLFSGLGAALGHIFGGIWDNIKRTTEQALHAVVQTVVNMAKGILDALSHIPGPISDMAKKAKASLDSLDAHTKAKTADMSAAAAMNVAKMHAVSAMHFEQMRRKLIEEIANTSDPVKKKALEMRLGVVTNAEQTEKNAARHFQALAVQSAMHADAMASHMKTKSKEMHDGVIGHVQDMVGNVLGKVGELKDQFVARIHQGIENVKTTLHNGFERIKETILAPIHFVVHLFEWLYQHNYYFQHLVDAIRKAFTNARDFIIGLWTHITGWLSEQWNRIKTEVQQKWAEFELLIHLAIQHVHDFIVEKVTAVKDWLLARWHDVQKDAEAAWDLVQQKILKPVEDVVKKVQDKIAAVRDWILGKWNEIKHDAQAAWDNFVASITGIVDRVKTAISNVISNITTPITNLATQALDWGQNLIQQFINGIQNMASKAGDAAKNVVSNVAKFLGFHSPAEAGPGKDADTWAPNLMQMFAQGMEDGTPALVSVATRAAQALRDGLTGSGALPLGAVGAGAGAGAGGDTYISVDLTIEVSGDEADGAPEEMGMNIGTAIGSSVGQAFKAELAQRGY